MSTPKEKFCSFVEQHSSQAEVARQLGVHRSLITHLLSGRRRPSFAVAAAIEDLTHGWIRAVEWAPPTNRAPVRRERRAA